LIDRTSYLLVAVFFFFFFIFSYFAFKISVNLSDEKLVKAWFSGWMSRDIAEDKRQQQRLKQEGLVN
jgi:hypothetical protein